MDKCIPVELIAILKEKVLKGEVTPEDVAKMLPEERTALKAILEEFVAEKFKVKVSGNEVKEIRARAKVIDVAQKKLGKDIGNPLKYEENLEFFQAKKSMDDYLMSRNPSNRLKVITGTIGRGMMLFSIKSPILNIGTNLEIGLTEALSRRIARGEVQGGNIKLATEYVSFIWQIYQKTGYDLSRMTALNDLGARGARVLGDTVHAEGEGKIRAVGRFVEDIVFKQLMGAPDVAFSAMHFADSVNLHAYRLSNGNKELGDQIMLDAMKLEPETPEGLLTRQQAILDAQVATWTNKSWASSLSEGVRKLMNNLSGDARMGDFLFPFVKTPANVIATGMEYAGGGIVGALWKTAKAFRAKNIGTKEHYEDMAQGLVRSGIGLIGALVIASQLNEDDFVGAYDPARAQIEELRNSSENSIRINGKWVSVNWLGPLSVPVTSIMYARKYGNTGREMSFQYGKGTVSSALDLPGIKDAADFFRTQDYSKNQTLGEMSGEAFNYATSQAYSRLVPSFISDLAKATDTFDRKTARGWSSIQNKIPGVRQTLPIKTNIFGESIIGESGLSDIFFGARVKTDKENALIKEIVNVADANGKSISFTNWDKSSNKSLAQFKEKKGEQVYQEAKIKYGQILKTILESEIAKSGYQNKSDADKLKILNDADATAMKRVFGQYRFTYKKESATPPVFGINSKVDERTFIKKIADYAKAIDTDPATALANIVKGENIVRGENGTVFVQRISKNKSEAIKKAGGGDNETMKLDHTIPLQLGGTNDANNLKLVPTDAWKSYTPVENFLGKKLKEGADKKAIQKAIADFKAGTVTFEQIKQQFK